MAAMTVTSTTTPEPARARSRGRKVLRIALGTLAAAAAVMALLHMPFARRILMRVGGCPMANGASPQKIEEARMDSVRKTRGTTLSPARPALGFALEGTTISELRAWASSHGITCKEKRESTLIQCVDVPASALGESFGEGTISELSLSLRPSTMRVVNITAVRFGLSAADASSTMASITGRLKQRLGEPTTAEGDPSTQYLAAGDYHTAVVDYRFSDYMATVSVTRIPERGVLLREHYISARD